MSIMPEVDKTTIQLMLKEPFYGHFFTQLLKGEVEDIPTAAIMMNPSTNTLKLGVNPKFWMEELTVVGDKEKTKKLRYGVIKHEILHIVFKHMMRYNDYTNKGLYNISADLVINQFIERDNLPENGMFLDTYPDFDLKPDQTLDYYYQVLRKEHDKAREILKQESKKSDESGKGSSGAGSGNTGTPPGWDKLNESQQRLVATAQQRENDHKSWESFGKLKESFKDFVESQIDKALETTVQRVQKKNQGSNDWGNIPGKLREMIEQMIESRKPNVNWKKQLKLFTANAQTTYLKTTAKKVSRRYGTTPGLKLKRRQRLLVAIDTSGSVDTESLMTFFSEMYHIYKSGAEIRVVECDTQIGSVWDYRGTPPEGITGRGGTCFNPPLQYANDEFAADAIIYFTDGFAPAPSVKTKAPILWMVCANGGCGLEAMENFPGRAIKMAL